MKLLHAFVLGIVAAALASCGEPPAPEEFSGEASPAIWEITSANGQVEGWLFGTIHALPDGVAWRTTVLDVALNDADILVVEVKDIDQPGAISSVYNRLSRSPDLKPLFQRVRRSDRAALSELLGEAGYSEGDFTELETWAVALTVAQLTDTGETENGVDRALLRSFDHGPIRELETIESQLSTFDSLPQDDQDDLLASILHQADKLETRPFQLGGLWYRGDVEQIDTRTREALLSDEELLKALLIDRNTAWVPQITAMLADQPQPFIAVGTAHLAGEHGLPALLAAQGYRTRRIQ